MIYPELSKQVVESVFKVHGELGQGLLEQCYHNALYYELKNRALAVEYNAPFSVSYGTHVVGEYFADLLVESKIILELKVARDLAPEHYAQLLNYLSISGCKLGFLVNFRGYRPTFKRMVL